MTVSNLPAPPAEVKPAPQKFSTARLLNRDGLLLKAEAMQATRDQNARRSVKNYELLFVEGYRYAQGVRKLSDGTGYQMGVTLDGVNECSCDDYRNRIAPINDGLRAAGLSFRCECKHGLLLHLLERIAAAQKGGVK